MTPAYSTKCPVYSFISRFHFLKKSQLNPNIIFFFFVLMQSYGHPKCCKENCVLRPAHNNNKTRNPIQYTIRLQDAIYATFPLHNSLGLALYASVWVGDLPLPKVLLYLLFNIFATVPRQVLSEERIRVTKNKNKGVSLQKSRVVRP